MEKLCHISAKEIYNLTIGWHSPYMHRESFHFQTIICYILLLLIILLFVAAAAKIFSSKTLNDSLQLFRSYQDKAIWSTRMLC